jgi:outer membrane receptor protein involved in Fe transport
MLRRTMLGAALIALVTASGLASAQDATTPPPAAPPAAEPTPAEPAPAESPPPAADQPTEVVVGDQQEAAPAAGDEERTEEIVVTGTRIRRKDLTTPAPVTVINRDAIIASGKVNLGDFLQALPEQGNALNTQVNNGGTGATRVDLRGLGNLRTLVLVNGRRMVFTGTGIQTGSGVDLNTIPTAAVERIEVLKDGASAVYGSDAIGGVINVITKKGYSGSEVNAYAGTTTRGDGEIFDVNFTTGTGGERGSVLFSAGFTDQRKVMAGERGFSRYQLAYDYETGEVIRSGSTRAPGGRIFDGGLFEGTGNQAWQDLLATGGTSFIYDPTNPATAATGGYRTFRAGELPPDGDDYNFQPLNYNVTPNRRVNLFTIGDARLGSAARAYFEGSYTARRSEQQLAPEPLIIGTGGTPVIVSRLNHYNPFARDFDNLTLRMESVGTRNQEQDFDTFRVVGGLDGSFGDLLPNVPALSSWSWDASLNYGRTTGTWVYRGNLISSRLQNAVNPSFVDAQGVAHCLSSVGDDGLPSADDPRITGCVPLDVFHGAAGVTPEMVNYISFTGPNRLENSLTAVQLNTSGELFPILSERPIGVAAGYEFRHESGAFIPDPINQKGDGTGGAVDETSGSYDVHEAYLELLLPIVNGLPFADDVEASVAARVFNYSTFGSDWTYKLGARWRIVPDVTVRGTYSTAFRAPAITELYLGASDNFPFATDPCAGPGITATLPGPDGIPGTGDDVANPLFTNCGGAVNNGDDSDQLRSVNAGTPDLEPETADIFTVGLVLQPRWVKNLSVTIDYYRIDIQNSITTFGVPYILSQCYSETAPADPAFCGLVTRDASDRITSIDDFNVNVGGDETAGLDFALRYALPTQVGRFGFAFDATWLQYYDREIAGGQIIDGRGTFDLGTLLGGTGGVYPKWKALTGLTWGLGGLGAGVSMRYVGSFTECESGLCSENPSGLSREVSAYYLWDAFASYELEHRFGASNVAIGVRNVFDQAPPVIYNSFTPTSDPTAYDFLGRFAYLTVGHRF